MIVILKSFFSQTYAILVKHFYFESYAYEIFYSAVSFLGH